MTDIKAESIEKELSSEELNAAPFLEPGMGSRIRAAVEKAGGVTKAAKIAGVSPESMRRYMKEDTSPTFEAIARLSQVSGVPMGWIATGRGEDWSVKESAASYGSSGSVGLSGEDVAAILLVIERQEHLRSLPIEDKAVIIKDLVDNQLRIRERDRQKALAILEERPPSK